jgi:hypothetical protein
MRDDDKQLPIAFDARTCGLEVSRRDLEVLRFWTATVKLLTVAPETELPVDRFTTFGIAGRHLCDCPGGAENDQQRSHN